MKKISFQRFFLPILLIAGFLIFQSAAARDFDIQSSAGVPYLKILGSTGYVGIGTTTPQSNLSIYGNSVVQGGVNTEIQNIQAIGYTSHRFGNDLGRNRWQFGIGSSGENVYNVKDKFYIYNSAADKMFMAIDTAGNVGVGTTTPSFNLDVTNALGDASVGLNAFGVFNSYLSFKTVGGTYQTSFGLAGTSGQFFSNATIGDFAIRAPSSKKILLGALDSVTTPAAVISGTSVGVGTTTPSYNLDVVGTSQFSQPVIVGTPTLASHAATKSYVDSAFTGGSSTSTLANLVVTGTTTLATTAGSVGIGTTTPTSLFVIASSNASKLSLTTAGALTLAGGITAGGTIQVPSANSFQWGGGNSSISAPSSGGNAAGTMKFFMGGVPMVQFVGITNATNTFTFQNSATGGPLIISASGTDSNIGFAIMPKGTGNVGIGTTTPQEALSVVGNVLVGAAGTASFGNNRLKVGGGISLASTDSIEWSGTNTRIAGTASGPINFYTTDGTQRMVITNTGVGIATTTPSYTLDVVGTSQFSQPVIVGTPTLASHAATKSYVDSAFTGGSTTGTLATLVVSGTTTLATTGGRVGIGTTTPASTFVVAGTSNITGSLYLNSVGSPAGNGVLRIGGSSTGLTLPGTSGYVEWGGGNTKILSGSTGTSGGGSFAFYLGGTQTLDVSNQGSDVNYLSLVSAAVGQPVKITVIGADIDEGINIVPKGAGYVGIGTTTPAARLDVAGAANATQLIVHAFKSQTNANPLAQLRSAGNAVLSSWHSDSATNVFLGYNNAPNNNITGVGSDGQDNVFVGYLVGSANATGTRNTAVGSEALEYNSIGTYNSAFGAFSSSYNMTGNNNSSFGQFSLYNNQTGSNNSSFGAQSGYNNSSGSGNVFLGYRAGYNETGSNKLYIANSSTNPPLIYGDFALNRIGIATNTPSYALDVAGGAQFSQPIIVGSPTLDSHAATKSYVDSAFTGGTTASTLAQLSVNGTTSLAMTGGYVAIGTTTSAYKLAVEGSVYINGLFNTSGDMNVGNYAYAKRFYDLDDNNWYIDPASASVMSFMAIGGGISVGTTTPPGNGNGLQAFSSSIFYASSSFGGPIVIGTTTPPNDAQVPLVVRGTSSFIGRIGVGVSSPSYDFSFDGDSAHTIGAERKTASGAGYSMTVQAGGASSTSNAAGGGLILSGGISTGNASSVIQFYTATAGGSASTARTPTVKMTLSGGGSLGIGITNPAYTLDVSGTGQFSQPILVGTPTLDGHAATKGYVDPYAVFLKVTGTGTSTYSYYTLKDNVGIGDYSLSSPKAKLEVDGGVRLTPTGGQPACNSTIRGEIWYTSGAALIKDKFEVCAKDAADAYAWRTIY